MESYYYVCEYCQKEFIPKRRKVQKYCSNSCRSRSYQLKNKNTKINIVPPPITNFNDSPILAEVVDQTEIKEKTNKNESMSLSGVGNSTAGTLIADGLKSLLTSQKNKPATKSDLENLKEVILGRYHPIKNLPPKLDGTKPFYDIIINEVIYF
jgi:hypothetical protein